MTGVAGSVGGCLWLGPLASRAAVEEFPALSPAAVEWERGFIGALVEKGMQVRAVTHLPAAFWPRGPLLPWGKGVPGDVACATELVGYLNAPFIRSPSLAAAYVQAVTKLLRGCQPDFLATFNLLPWHLAAANTVRATHHIPWLSFLLDDVSSDPKLEKYARLSKAAAGHVLVSAEAVNRLRALLPQAAILHLDGGVERFHGSLTGETGGGSRSILYCGSHSDEAGMTRLVEAIPLVAEKDVAFVITGNRGSHEGLARLAARDCRVHLTGLVPPHELDALCAAATAFVNPRPSGHALSLASFPSKLLRYLSFGKPIASTWTPGLAEEYRPLLVVAADDSPKSLASAMETAISFDPKTRDALMVAARNFLIPGHLWASQVDRFIGFVGGLLQPHAQGRWQAPVL